MLDGGEDRLFVARRLVRFANEDIGVADPHAIQQALAAWDVYERLGSPEGELAIAQAVVYLATAPKSIAIYRGFNAAHRSARRTGSLMPPARNGYEAQITERLRHPAVLRARRQRG
ncbi:AAA family ATPase [Streptomyces niveus]|uniref:AAA family ATPase n=1 Tax=Streptomyces niveus TaxID=193462 RepID=UPI003699EC87